MRTCGHVIITVGGSDHADRAQEWLSSLVQTTHHQ